LFLTALLEVHMQGRSYWDASDDFAGSKARQLQLKLHLQLDDKRIMRADIRFAIFFPQWGGG
jgi:hypothetical protein